MVRLLLEHLTKQFRGPSGETVRAVEDLNLAMEPGELVVLTGPSGCGKTTTLRLIAGLEQPTGGTISINGTQVTDLPPAKRDVAMVFQHFALYPDMTAYENIAFGLRLRKCPRGELDQRVREAAEMLDLTTCLDRKPAALSGGQRQRVALGRALVRRPAIFLLDEPLSNLDPPMRTRMRTELARLHHRLNATMLYVTHDQTEAMTLGTRVIVLRDGVLQQAASPLTLYRQPANLFVAGFVGSPAMNVFTGTVVHRNGGVFFDVKGSFGQHANPERGSLAQPAQPLPVTEAFSLQITRGVAEPPNDSVGRELLLGIRPEDVHEAGAAPELPPANRVEGLVELVEPAGAETYLQVRRGDAFFTARVRAGAVPGLNSKVILAFDMRCAHFFDLKTGNRI